LGQALRSVHPLPNVLRDLAIELRLEVGELVVNGIGPAFGKERSAIELEELLLYEAAHEIRWVHHVDSISKAALEPVRIEEGHEELKVLLLPAVRSGREEQEVAGESTKEFAELVSLGLLDLTTEEVGGHLVRLVDDNEIPVEPLVAQPGLHVLIPAQLVQAANDRWVAEEGVRDFLQALAGNGLEVQLEPIPHLVLPLFNQVAGADNETAVDVSSHPKLLDQQASHDGLASPGVVRQEKPKGLPGKHLPVYACDLVWQRFQNRRVDGQERVEEVREAYPVRFRDKPQESTIGVK